MWCSGVCGVVEYYGCTGVLWGVVYVVNDDVLGYICSVLYLNIIEKLNTYGFEGTSPASSICFIAISLSVASKSGSL